MKMSDMDKYLTDRGLFLKREYLPETCEYKITLGNGELTKSFLWKYPSNSKNPSQSQKEALDNMVKSFREQQVILNALKAGCNNLYGTIDSGYVYFDTDKICLDYKEKNMTTMQMLKEIAARPQIPELNGRKLEIKKVHFNDPLTVVIWSDGTKTFVKAHNEPFDPEKGLAMAISKKFLGNKYNYYNHFEKWLNK